MKNDGSTLTGFVSNAVCIMAVMEIILMLSSWIVPAAFPATGLRSLINSEGIRWFLGSFTENIGNDVSVWLLLSAMAYGCVARSGICKLLKSIGNLLSLTFRERLAFALVSAEILMVSIVMLLLTCVPQAILLSATGELFPSSFSRSIVPVADFVLVVSSVTCGIVTEHITTFSDIVGCFIYGCQRGAPVFVLYVFVCQLACSVAYVFAL